MSTCINLEVPLPEIPPFLVAIAAFQLTETFPPEFPDVGFPCCVYKIPIRQFPLPFPPTPSFATEAINAAILAALKLMPHVNLPACSRNGVIK